LSVNGLTGGWELDECTSEFGTIPETDVDAAEDVVDLTGEIEADDADLVALGVNEVPTKRSLAIIALLASHEMAVARQRHGQDGEPPAEFETDDRTVVDEDFLDQLPTRVRRDPRQHAARAHRKGGHD